ncbi:glycosyltransferase [Gulosibacter sp. GYB002]|uniref:glycosyltransferase n=1 Tax=Gulosibacter sp. GYB002 TaxID=2994391 RepID=UPI002F96336B
MPCNPSIAVLLATHNGEEYVAEQISSVLAQDAVDVTVFVSDDASQDDTLAIIRSMAESDRRLQILEPGEFGSAGKNFYRLIRDTDVDGFDAVAFCDQDDIWEPWKLRRHFELLTGTGPNPDLGRFDAVSSNVMTFDASGKTQLIVKNQSQRLLDYAFESGGPGSTFLLRSGSYAFIRATLLDPSSTASQVPSHDWCIYALIRARNGRWFIDGEPSVRYRQHEKNVLGANQGWRQHWARFAQIANGNHRRDTAAVTSAVAPISRGKQAQRLQWLQERVGRRDFTSRLQLARRASLFRRRRRDQLALAAFILLGIW